MTDPARTVLLSWDQRPDLDALAKAVLDLSGGRVHIHQADTGTDDYAIVIADRHLESAKVQAEWLRHWNGET